MQRGTERENEEKAGSVVMISKVLSAWVSSGLRITSGREESFIVFEHSLKKKKLSANTMYFCPSSLRYILSPRNQNP
jgi:hypothetical protein